MVYVPPPPPGRRIITPGTGLPPGVSPTLRPPPAPPAPVYPPGYVPPLDVPPLLNDPGYVDGPPPLDPNRGYELYPTVLGKGVPLNVALAAANLFRPSVQFHLLGTYAQDWRRGFQLSGPRGPVLYAGLQAGYAPEDLGTPAFVGALIWIVGSGPQVTLLGNDFLSSNVGPNWWAL